MWTLKNKNSVNIHICFFHFPHHGVFSVLKLMFTSLMQLSWLFPPLMTFKCNQIAFYVFQFFLSLSLLSYLYLNLSLTWIFPNENQIQSKQNKIFKSMTLAKGSNILWRRCHYAGKAGLLILINGQTFWIAFHSCSMRQGSVTSLEILSLILYSFPLARLLSFKGINNQTFVRS